MILFLFKNRHTKSTPNWPAVSTKRWDYSENYLLVLSLFSKIVHVLQVYLPRPCGVFQKPSSNSKVEKMTTSITPKKVVHLLLGGSAWVILCQDSLERVITPVGLQCRVFAGDGDRLWPSFGTWCTLIKSPSPGGPSMNVGKGLLVSGTEPTPLCRGCFTHGNMVSNHLPTSDRNVRITPSCLHDLAAFPCPWRVLGLVSWKSPYCLHTGAEAALQINKEFLPPWDHVRDARLQCDV